MEQLFDLDAIKGLTIDSACAAKEDIIIKFSNNKFIVFKEGGFGAVEISKTLLDLTPNAFNCDFLLKLGVITEKDRIDVIEKFEIENNALVRKLDLMKLNELKLKYPDVI